MTGVSPKSLIVGAAIALVLAGGYFLVQSRSQAILQHRYALAPSGVHAATAPEQVALGHHLVETNGCALCHGKQMAGRMLGAAGSPLAAPNLTRVVARRSDAELDRGIRAGVRADGTSEFGMPSHVYSGFSDAETAAMIGYLRTLKPVGPPTPRQPPGFMQRFDMTAGWMHPEAARLSGVERPIDLGPRYAQGRHLAAMACGQCHGTDLSSGHHAPGPDLMVRGGYSRAQFHTLLRTGETPSGRELDLMSETARLSFSHFSDAEIDALYDYLFARDVKLDAAGPAKH
jgi:mono/diheme cytochrome c family protein